MSLRRQLAILALLLLLLPLAGWQIARQIEQFLRASEQRALEATASAVARSIQDVEFDHSSGIYVKRIEYNLTADGYDDEWRLWRRWQHQIAVPERGLRLSALLAENGRRLWVLIHVNDLSRETVRGETDQLELGLRNRRGQRRYQLTAGEDGALQVARLGQDQPGTLPPVHGAWRPVDDGYLVELDLPLSLVDELSLRAFDSGRPQTGAPAVWVGQANGWQPLQHYQLTLAETLDSLLASGTRGWVLDSNGWVRAHAGQLVTAGEATGRSWWQGLVYRWLIGPSLERAFSREPDQHWQLQGTEVTAALTGETKTVWRSASSEYTVLASTAIALPGGGVLLLEQSSDSLLLAANRTLWRIGLWSLLAVGLSGGVVFAFASSLLVRIRRLRNAVDNALADDVDIERFVASRRRDEIGDLSRGFADVLRELRQYNDYLKSLASKLSHELNTPLAVVRSSLDNLAHEPLDAGSTQFADRARQGVERLQTILRAMSEAQRLEQSIDRQDPEWFSVNEVLRGCYESCRQLDSAHQWELKLPEHAMRLFGSPELVEQLLDKLTDNARSFCPDGGRISLMLTAHSKGIRIAVGNDGPSLPDELRQRLFDSMVSMRSGKDNESHLGLGLHIVRLVARAHRGRVFASNRAQGGVEIGVVLDGMRLPANRPPDAFDGGQR